MCIKYFSGEKMENNKIYRTCSICGEGRDVCRVLVEKLGGKRALVILRPSWEYNNAMVFRKWNLGAWIRSSWLRIRKCGGHVLML
jgi:hypothetical protein